MSRFFWPSKISKINNTIATPAMMNSDHDPTTSESDEQQPTTQAATRIPKPTKGNGKLGRSNYSREELFSLLATMERILPVGPEEWEQVVLEHSSQYPGRDTQSIRRKYTALHRKKPSTGNPIVPPEVLIAARHVKKLLGHKVNLGGGEKETLDIETGFSGQDQPQEQIPGATENTQPSAATVPVLQQTGGGLARARSSQSQGVVSSPVPRKSKDSNQEFLDLMRMKILIEREERREERRERHEDWVGLISAVVGGVASVFGVEPPRTGGTRTTKRKRKYKDSSSDESVE